MLHAASYMDQHAIARIVSVGIVNRFETVKVDVNDGHFAFTPLGMHHGLLQPIRQQQAIR
jgi:hypothetical protein